MFITLVMIASRSSAQDDGKKKEALQHFEIGLELAKQEAWDGALAEFLKSRELYPTKNALKNAGVCLRELKRWDEALDMYDELITRFGGDLSPEDRKLVDDDRQKLSKFVGSIELDVEVSGARVVIDGRERGVTPLTKPIRVAVGTRAVSVSKAGYAPFETKVLVASGDVKHVRVTLASWSDSGKLKVRETNGGVFEVLVDGSVVGKTPYEGTLPAGPHSVALRGPNGTGTPVASYSIVAQETKDIVVAAGALPGQLTVIPTPADASVSIDGAPVVRGRLTRELPPGEHTIDVSAPWCRSERQVVVIANARTEQIAITLRSIRRFAIGVQWGANIFNRPTGIFDGNPGEHDGGGTNLDVRVGYRLHSLFALEAGAGIRWAQIRPVNPDSRPSHQIRDELVMILGPHASVGGSMTLGYAFPFVVRTFTGVWWAPITMQHGRVADPPPALQTETTRNLGEASESRAVPFVGGEVKIGVRLGAGFVIDLGMQTTVLFLSEVTHTALDTRSGRNYTVGVAGGPWLSWMPMLGFRVEL